MSTHPFWVKLREPSKVCICDAINTLGSEADYADIQRLSSKLLFERHGEYMIASQFSVCLVSLVNDGRVVHVDHGTRPDGFMVAGAYQQVLF